MIYEGQDVIADLERRYPSCHQWFGDFQDPQHFFAILEQPGWRVIRCGLCYSFAEDYGSGVYHVHWFCPHGSVIADLRAIVGHLFDTGVESIAGIIPAGKKYSMASRIISRAIGADKIDGVYVLTKDQF